VILGFIGVKMLFEALHGSGVEHVGPVTVPTIGIAVSLGVIIGVLAITTVTSLWSTRRAQADGEGQAGAPESDAPNGQASAAGERAGRKAVAEPVAEPVAQPVAKEEPRR